MENPFKSKWQLNKIGQVDPLPQGTGRVGLSQNIMEKEGL